MQISSRCWNVGFLPPQRTTLTLHFLGIIVNVFVYLCVSDVSRRCCSDENLHLCASVLYTINYTFPLSGYSDCVPQPRTHFLHTANTLGTRKHFMAETRNLIITHASAVIHSYTYTKAKILSTPDLFHWQSAHTFFFSPFGTQHSNENTFKSLSLAESL